jgi:hypothetical protein
MKVMARAQGEWSDLTVMCITIPSSANVDRSRRIPLWHWLTETPLRLLCAGGGISLALGLLYPLYGLPITDVWLLFNLFFGILPFFIFALLLDDLPGRLKVTPLRYVAYGSLFFLMLAGQMVFHLSMALGDGPGWVYLVTTLFPWIWFLRVFDNFLKTSYLSGQKGSRALFLSLLWGGVSATVAGVVLISWQPMPLLVLIGGLSYLLPGSLFYLVSRFSLTP